MLGGSRKLTGFQNFDVWLSGSNRKTYQDLINFILNYDSSRLNNLFYYSPKSKNNNLVERDTLLVNSVFESEVVFTGSGIPPLSLSFSFKGGGERPFRFPLDPPLVFHYTVNIKCT